MIKYTAILMLGVLIGSIGGYRTERTIILDFVTQRKSNESLVLRWLIPK